MKITFGQEMPALISISRLHMGLGRPSMRTLCALSFVFILTSCSGVFYFPSREMNHFPEHLGLEYSNVWIKSEDLRLHGWFLPSVKDPDSSPCVLFLHGNALNIGNHLFSVNWMPEQGINVLLFDYRGYGYSEGSSSLVGLREDAHAALEYIVQDETCQGSDLFILGQSLGGAIAVELYATTEHQQRVSGLIIDSAFSSYRDIFQEKLSDFFITWPFQMPLRYLVDDRFSPKEFAASLPETPKLIIHGQADTTVPYHHSQILYDLSPEPKEFLNPKGVGHIAGFGIPEIRQRVIDFIYLPQSLEPSLE